MKHKVKNRMIKGVSLALAATAVTGLLLQTTMSVQAATAMPGIETIIKDNSEDKPFRILELVDNSADAEIGYYISGQEPYIKLSYLSLYVCMYLFVITCSLNQISMLMCSFQGTM